MKKIILSIEGMTCSACSNGLEKYLNKQNGIANASVNLVMANALIEYDEKLLNQSDLERFVAKAGFKSLGEFKELKIEKKAKSEKIVFIIFSILAIILMYISMGHMLGLPVINFLNPHTNPINYVVALIVFAIIFIIYGFDIIKNGYRNLIHATPNMDTLVGIGVISSFLYSLFGAYKILKGDTTYVENLYFESTAIVIYFVKLGRYVDGISKDKTKEAIQKLVKMTPNNATIKIDGKEKVVTIDEIKKGDIVISKLGEKLAVDGEILSGKAHLDEAFITGESKPQLKTVGDKVIAGSLNYNGYIEYKALKIGKESTISEIVKLVLEATNTKAPISKLADKVSGYFVPIVISIAIVTFLLYLILGSDFQTALITFVTILVIACPCSLGLATPLAIVVSEGKCASNGILVKKSEVLETASKIDTVVFDKTGTLTYGKLKVAEIKNYSEFTNEEIMQLAGSVEAKSTHPISKAFESYLEENKIEKIEVENFEDVIGYGITATIKDVRVILGNAKILKKYNIENKYSVDEKNLASQGNSVIYVIKETEIIALIGVNDIIRDNVCEVIEKLHDNKIQTIMLTGDNKETAEKIAKEIKISKVISNVLPAEKLDVIRKLKQDGKHVMMCGDGINDSPALAIADIGVSVKSGTDIAMDSADVLLLKNELTSITELIDISKKTIKNIKQNLFWAFFYNALMIPIAIGVLKPIGVIINPMVASLAMVLSSLTVILNTLRLKK